MKREEMCFLQNLVYPKLKIFTQYPINYSQVREKLDDFDSISTSLPYIKQPPRKPIFWFYRQNFDTYSGLAIKASTITCITSQDLYIWKLVLK